MSHICCIPVAHLLHSCRTPVAFLSRIYHRFLAALPRLGMLPNLAAPGHTLAYSHDPNVDQTRMGLESSNGMFTVSLLILCYGRPKHTAQSGLDHMDQASLDRPTKLNTAPGASNASAKPPAIITATCVPFQSYATQRVATTGHILAEHCKRCKHRLIELAR